MNQRRKDEIITEILAWVAFAFIGFNIVRLIIEICKT